MLKQCLKRSLRAQSELENLRFTVRNCRVLSLGVKQGSDKNSDFPYLVPRLDIQVLITACSHNSDSRRNRIQEWKQLQQLPISVLSFIFVAETKVKHIFLGQLSN